MAGTYSRSSARKTIISFECFVHDLLKNSLLLGNSLLAPILLNSYRLQ